MFSNMVRGGKFYVDRSADAVKQGRHDEALADLELAVSFFPDSAQLAQLMQLVKEKKTRVAVRAAAADLPTDTTK